MVEKATPKQTISSNVTIIPVTPEILAQILGSNQQLNMFPARLNPNTG